jgi:hypothetical protein
MDTDTALNTSHLQSQGYTKMCRNIKNHLMYTECLDICAYGLQHAVPR